jgi:hypothetical protein
MDQLAQLRLKQAPLVCVVKQYHSDGMASSIGLFPPKAFLDPLTLDKEPLMTIFGCHHKARAFALPYGLL